MKQQFFGNPESQLFGVYHPPRGKANDPPRAVLICPPIGQEFIRTHWCLRLMANQLSRAGVHVMRMDYAGIGDSAGRIEEVMSIETWHENIRQAVSELKQQSGAQTIMLVGLRFGATMAATVARTSLDVNSIVLWEPVTDGLVYLNELREMHRQMLDLWVCKMNTPNDELVEEIVGSRYSRQVIREIENEITGFGDVIQPQLIIDPEVNGQSFIHPEPTIQRVIKTDEEYSWNDLRVLETAWLRPQTTRTIVQNVSEMFERLQKHNALKQPALIPSANQNLTIASLAGAL